MTSRYRKWNESFFEAMTLPVMNAILAIGHFRVHLSLHFKVRLSAKSLLWKSVFIHIEIGTNYHSKNFALRLALKERLIGTQKWPIAWRIIEIWRRWSPEFSRLLYAIANKIAFITVRSITWLVKYICNSFFTYITWLDFISTVQYMIHFIILAKSFDILFSVCNEYCCF